MKKLLLIKSTLSLMLLPIYAIASSPADTYYLQFNNRTYNSPPIKVEMVNDSLCISTQGRNPFILSPNDFYGFRMHIYPGVPCMSTGTSISWKIFDNNELLTKVKLERTDDFTQFNNKWRFKLSYEPKDKIEASLSCEGKAECTQGRNEVMSNMYINLRSR